MNTILRHINDSKNDTIYKLFITTLYNLNNDNLNNDNVDDIHISSLTYITSPLSVDDATLLAQHLCLQFNILESTYSQSITFIRLSDITVLNNNIFIISNLENIVNLHNKTEILLICPSTNFNYKTCAPELLHISSLPICIHKGASYYSIGLLCLYVSGMHLNGIKHTRLFYFITRCLNISPQTRKCLFV